MVTTTNAYAVCRSVPVPFCTYGPEMYINKIKTFLAHLRNQLNVLKKLYILYSIWPYANPGANVPCASVCLW